MIRKRNNHRGDGPRPEGPRPEGKFQHKGGRKYGGGGGGNGGGRGDNAARTVARATSMREKYTNLARDALSYGDRIAAENWFQHADHYYRVIRAAQEDREEFERYANRPQPQGMSDDFPEQESTSTSHLPAFLKGNPPQQNADGQPQEVIDEDDQEPQRATQ